MSRRHVFRDLRAYICTFSDCNNPDKQYSTQQDWFNHERQVHRRQWYCGQHEAYYNSSELLVDHLNQSHSEEIPQEHVQSFVTLSERSTDRHTNTPCPLCPEVRPLMELEGHLAEHLESIALFVLGADFDAADSGKGEDLAHSDSSSQLWSHPSVFSIGSQVSPEVLQGRSSNAEDDLESALAPQFGPQVALHRQALQDSNSNTPATEESTVQYDNVSAEEATTKQTLS